MALRYEASVPTISALNPSLAKSDLLEGASSPMPPTCMAIELKFAKPHSAKLTITTDLADKTPEASIGASFE